MMSTWPDRRLRQHWTATRVTSVRSGHAACNRPGPIGSPTATSPISAASPGLQDSPSEPTLRRRSLYPFWPRRSRSGPEVAGGRMKLMTDRSGDVRRDDVRDVLRTVWAAKGETGADLDEDCSPTKSCKNMVGVSFDGLGAPGSDLRSAWREKLEREGKPAGPEGSIRDIVLASGSARLPARHPTNQVIDDGRGPTRSSGNRCRSHRAT